MCVYIYIDWLLGEWRKQTCDLPLSKNIKGRTSYSSFLLKDNLIMLCFWTLRYESWRAPTSNSYQVSHEVLAATWKEQVETCLAEWQEWRQNDVHERSDAFICRSYDGFARVAMSMGTNQLILGLYLGTNNCIFCSGQILNAKIWACRLGTSPLIYWT